MRHIACFQERKRQREVEHRVAHSGFWHHVFFGDQLDDVRQRLKQSMPADVIRTGPHLHVRDDFTLDPLQVGKHVHQHADYDRDLDEGDDVVVTEQFAHG